MVTSFGYSGQSVHTQSEIECLIIAGCPAAIMGKSRKKLGLQLLKTGIKVGKQKENVGQK